MIKLSKSELLAYSFDILTRQFCQAEEITDLVRKWKKKVVIQILFHIVPSFKAVGVVKIYLLVAMPYEDCPYISF